MTGSITRIPTDTIAGLFKLLDAFDESGARDQQFGERRRIGPTSRAAYRAGRNGGEDIGATAIVESGERSVEYRGVGRKCLGLRPARDQRRVVVLHPSIDVPR